ncbi:MAG: lytic transglycosylase domain-containing protein [Saprospiraceae bacterium]
MKFRHYLFIALYALLPILSKAECSIKSYNFNDFNEKILFNYYEEEIIDRLRGMYTIVAITMDEDVLSQVKRFVVNDRSGSKSILYNADLYFPLIERLLFDNDLPYQLKNLAALESALNPKAVSYAGAAGLWQLMPETAKNLGLRVNKNIDERLDPVASTKAAISYLKKLYTMFGDWSLVLAAYNCGENKVQNLLEDNKTTDFESIKRFLPKQTQLFVPTFIGVSYMLEYYGEHDLTPSIEDMPTSYLTYVKIDKSVNLNNLYKQTLINKDLFKLYNPAFKYNEISKSDDGIYISLPDSMMVEFVDYYINLYHAKVDTATIVGSANGNLILDLISFSRPFINSPEKVSDSKVESIKYDLLDYAEVKDVPKTNTEWIRNYQYYILKTGESLLDVTAYYDGLTLEDLMEWNNISDKDIVATGTPLIVKR